MPTKRIRIMAGCFLSAVSLLAKADACRPNMASKDVCMTAKNIAAIVQQQLPRRLNRYTVEKMSYAVGNKIILLYELDYLEDTFKQRIKANGVSMTDVIKNTKSVVQTTLCKSNYSFIQMGGKIEINYSFSDGSYFMTALVERCE